MKKNFTRIIALAMCIFMISGISLAENRDVRLKEAFDAKTLSIVPFEFWDGSTDGYKLVIPASAAEEFISYTGLAAAFESNADGVTAVWDIPAEMVPEFMTMPPISISPDGAIMLATTTAPRGAIYFVLRGKTLTAIRPVHDRGVSDEHGKLEEHDQESILGHAGIEWSPDGRYAVKTNPHAALTTIKFSTYPLVIMDTYTGEMFLANALGGKRMKDEGGISALTGVEFSPDSRYLYCTVYGNTYGDIGTLLRYDLETGESTPLVSSSATPYMPHLDMLRDGSLISTNFTKDNTGLLVYQMIGDTWHAREMNLPEPPQHVKLYINEYSANSDYSLSTISFYTGSDMGLMRTRSQDSFAGLGQYWVIDDFDSAEAVTINIDDFSSTTLDDITSGAADGVTGPGINDLFLTIIDMALSPDGYYAIICVEKNGEYAILMLDLETMHLVRISAPSDLLSMALTGTITSTPYAVTGLTWFPDGRLIIPDSDGTPGIYILTDQ